MSEQISTILQRVHDLRARRAEIDTAIVAALNSLDAQATAAGIVFTMPEAAAAMAAAAKFYDVERIDFDIEAAEIELVRALFTAREITALDKALADASEVVRKTIIATFEATLARRQDMTAPPIPPG